MSLQPLNRADSRFFTTTYRLAQQSVEGFAFWKELLPHVKLRRLKYLEGLWTNEDLLRLLVTNAKRSFVVTSYILCDNEGQGQQGHNVFKLIDRCSKILPDFDAQAEIQLLHSPELVRAINQVRILRNNLDAHHAVTDDWKRPFGRFPTEKFEQLISTLYGIAIRCNRSVGLRRISECSLREANTVYADRLLRALTKQEQEGDVGKQFGSVEDWEFQVNNPSGE